MPYESRIQPPQGQNTNLFPNKLQGKTLSFNVAAPTDQDYQPELDMKLKRRKAQALALEGKGKPQPQEEKKHA